MTMSGRVQVAVTGTCCNWNAQLLEVMQCSFMETLDDDRAELENYCLWNWQPVKIILKCQCYVLEFRFHITSCKVGFFGSGHPRHQTEIVNGAHPGPV